MFSVSDSANVSILLPAMGISKAPCKRFQACHNVVKQATQYIRRVAARGGNVRQARRYLEAAERLAGEGSEIAALTAARRAISLAKSVLAEKSDKALRREGDGLLMTVDLTLDACAQTKRP